MPTIQLLNIRCPSLNNIYRRKRNGKVYKSSPHRELERDVKSLLKDMELTYFDKENIKMSVIFLLKGKRNPDCDNLCKSLLDLLQGSIYKNDKQITELHLYKFINCDQDKILIEYDDIAQDNILTQIKNIIENSVQVGERLEDAPA
jgi:Holliday junction resolvase RusA-like endonuclease